MIDSSCNGLMMRERHMGGSDSIVIDDDEGKAL